MPNSSHLEVLAQGFEAWNRWRVENPQERPDLSHANLVGAPLAGINLSGTNLVAALLMRADLSGADVHFSDLTCANLMDATLNGANLDGANLFCANFAIARMQGARMRRARLMGAVLVETDLTGADLTESWVYGVSAWNAKLEGAAQSGLVVTGPDQPKVTADHLEMAQFIDLVLRNENIRDALDTLTSKLVLILGRFSSERKAVLDAMRGALREQNYVPVIFDFEKPGQTTVETVSTLAHMARYVIADLTDAKSVLQELQAIVPISPSIVVQPLLLVSQEEPGMFDFIRSFPWVLEPVRYADKDDLLGLLKEQVIAAAESKVKKAAAKVRPSG